MASESSTFIRGTLIDAYPRIHYLFLDVCARAARSVSLRATGEGSDVMAHIVTRSRVGHGQTFSHSGGKVGPLLVQVCALACVSPLLFHTRKVFYTSGCRTPGGGARALYSSVPCSWACLGTGTTPEAVPHSVVQPSERSNGLHVSCSQWTLRGCSTGSTTQGSKEGHAEF